MADNCGGCKKDISEGKFLTALDQKWHPDCFKCAQCHKPVTGGSFSVNDSNQPVCMPCAGGTDGGFEPKTCEKCRKPIEGEYMNSPNGGSGHMHPSCFTCDACHQVIDGTKGFAKAEGKFLHPACAQKQVGGSSGGAPSGLCGACHKSLDGACVTAGKHSYHKECFKCNTCKGPISGSFFSDDDGKPLCDSCHSKLPSTARKFLPAHSDSEPRGTTYDIDKAKSGWTSTEKLAGDPSKAAREAMKTVNRGTGSYAESGSGSSGPATATASAAPSDGPKFCGGCGAKLNAGSKFCGECGNKN